MDDGSEEDEKAKFETLLAQVLTTDEDARQHRAMKNARGLARQDAATAKAMYETHRERPRKV